MKLPFYCAIVFLALGFCLPDTSGHVFVQEKGFSSIQLAWSKNVSFNKVNESLRSAKLIIDFETMSGAAIESLCQGCPGNVNGSAWAKGTVSCLGGTEESEVWTNVSALAAFDGLLNWRGPSGDRDKGFAAASFSIDLDPARFTGNGVVKIPLTGTIAITSTLHGGGGLMLSIGKVTGTARLELTKK